MSRAGTNFRSPLALSQFFIIQSLSLSHPYHSSLSLSLTHTYTHTHTHTHTRSILTLFHAVSQCASEEFVMRLQFTVTMYRDDFFHFFFSFSFFSFFFLLLLAKQLKEHLVSRAIIRSDGDGLPREIETLLQFSLSLSLSLCFYSLLRRKLLVSHSVVNGGCRECTWHSWFIETPRQNGIPRL